MRCRCLVTWLAQCHIQESQSHPIVFNALQDGGLHALDNFSAMLLSKEPCTAADCLSDPYFCVLQKLQANRNNAPPVQTVLLTLQQDLHTAHLTCRMCRQYTREGFQYTLRCHSTFTCAAVSHASLLCQSVDVRSSEICLCNSYTVIWALPEADR